MKLRYKIASGFVILVGTAVVVLALVVSYDADCPPPPGLAADSATMKAVVYRCYGSSDVLEYGDVEKPVPGDAEVLVKVRAAAVNPLDYHYMRGSPYIMRLSSGIGAPDDHRMGADFSGIVESVGANVTQFKRGDEVFGGRSGAFAEYVLVPEDRALAFKPPNISFEQAAAVPVAGLTALQALRDEGKLESGQKVLINGASGGVGTFAVQIAKAMGAEVTGVCSTRNLEMVRSLGADHVIDYTRENYTENGERYDLIIDMVGNHSLLANRKVMTANGRMVLVGGAKGNWIAPLSGPIRAMLLSPLVDQEIGMMLARLRKDDLAELAQLMAQGKVTPQIDRKFPLNEVPAAIDYSEKGHAQGKIIIGFD